MTRVVAPSRLHFGLLSLPGKETDRWTGVDGEPGQVVRRFGGVGLMVDRPGLTVRVEPASVWSAQGLLADRALTFAQRMVASMQFDEQRPYLVAVEHSPAEHSGLGVGTQLGLAVAKAIATEAGHYEWTTIELAERVGRGERSAIGVHGFDRGGLIVEAGKLDGERISTLVGKFAFPTEWSILLFSHLGAANWHSQNEREAFARLVVSEAETNALCRLILTGMLPALVSKDLGLFGEALYEFNARAGDMFAPVQGGRYASPAVADWIDRLRDLGVRGVGQSSWGPTVFAIVGQEQAKTICRNCPDVPTLVAASSDGARID